MLEDKATIKKNKITINKNGKGRLNQEGCEWIVAGAEKCKAEDDAQKQKVEARNLLENSRSKDKNVAGEHLGDTMSAEDKAAIEKPSRDGDNFDRRSDAVHQRVQTEAQEGY